MRPKQQHADKPRSAASARLYVPMLILLFALPVASWMLASSGHEKAPDPRFVTSAKSGPWGNLECIRIAIELPDHYIDIENLETNDWYFPAKNKSDVLAFLQSCELPPPQIEEMTKFSWETTAEGTRVFPTDDFLWNLTTACRARIYGYLAEYEGNVDQFNAFAYRPDRIDETLVYSALGEKSKSMFKQLLYPQGSLMRFADVDIVLRRIQDPAERLRFVKTVSRRSSLMVKLLISPETNIDELLNYWGGGGRAKDLRPFLESLARVPGGTKVDIVHLLPPFVRQRLYTYPSPTVATGAGPQDCHWTSMNFWNDSPRSTFSSPEVAAQAVEAEYFKVGNSLSQARLGDILFLQNKDGILVHSAVFIADDIVFTKNGAGANQPWICMRMEDMMPFYMSPNDTPRTVVYRRKSI